MLGSCSGDGAVRIFRKYLEFFSCGAEVIVLIVGCSGGNSRPSCPSGVGGGTFQRIHCLGPRVFRFALRTGSSQHVVPGRRARGIRISPRGLGFKRLPATEGRCRSAGASFWRRADRFVPLVSMSSRKFVPSVGWPLSARSAEVSRRLTLRSPSTSPRSRPIVTAAEASVLPWLVRYSRQSHRYILRIAGGGGQVHDEAMRVGAVHHAACHRPATGRDARRRSPGCY